MKITVVGDPHGSSKVKEIPLEETELILCTGDLGKSDLMRKMTFANASRHKSGLKKVEYAASTKKRAYMQAYNSSIRAVKYLSKFAPVYTIFGNVESSGIETRKLSKEIGEDMPVLSKGLEQINGVHVINNRAVDFQGVKIGGLEYFLDPKWVRDFKPDDFKKKMKRAERESAKAKKALKKIGEVDILICHQPPYGVLDQVNFPTAPSHWQGKHAGSPVILDHIKKKQPKYVFCGHIHEGAGSKKLGKTTIVNVGCAGKYFSFEI